VADPAILTLEIRFEHDVVLARQRARQIAGLLHFERQDQARIATAVSEIARNVYNYARTGRVEIRVEGRTAPQVLVIDVSDKGPGIRQLDRILAGQYRSETGMGLGIVGAKRLMDRFDIESAPQGTTVRLKKIFSRGAPFVTAAAIGAIRAELARLAPQNAFEEVQLQNQELIRALDELKRRQAELVRLNQELEDTNRGVVALYAELDEKADHLRRADDMKSRFLSNMSHEFRTPLNSMMALARILLDRTDGELTAEQEKQVGFIRKAAEDLTELVNDLLDLAKVEAGKTEIHPAEFQVADLFGALRGMLRPLLVSESVRLVFDEPTGVPPIYGDEGKVSQILRNFISNALKFTERGEIGVRAQHDAGRGAVTFSVSDTGIGIAAEDLERIFGEYQQVHNPIQRRVKGTGLGLPLSRKLAVLLQGAIEAESRPGEGSTFRLRVPVTFVPPVPEPVVVEEEPDPSRLPLLIVEDAPEALEVYRTLLRGTEFQILSVPTVQAARQALHERRPVAIVLDIHLRGEDAWGLLAEMKDGEARDVPVVVITNVDDEAKAMSLGADAYTPKPVERPWLLHTLRGLTRAARPGSVLIVDDDELSRYTLADTLRDTPFGVLEAVDGLEGLRRAREDQPLAIFLDLDMPGLDGFQVLDRLKADAATRDIPVFIVTSMVLTHGDRQRLESARAVLSKTFLGRGKAREEITTLLRGAGVVAERQASADA
jgi:signal transduction histidine kinase/CheY-like chemotaxis protein